MKPSFRSARKTEGGIFRLGRRVRFRSVRVPPAPWQRNAAASQQRSARRSRRAELAREIDARAVAVYADGIGDAEGLRQWLRAVLVVAYRVLPGGLGTR